MWPTQALGSVAIGPQLPPMSLPSHCPCLLLPCTCSRDFPSSSGRNLCLRSCVQGLILTMAYWSGNIVLPWRKRWSTDIATDKVNRKSAREDTWDQISGMYYHILLLPFLYINKGNEWIQRKVSVSYCNTHSYAFDGSKKRWEMSIQPHTWDNTVEWWLGRWEQAVVGWGPAASECRSQSY